MSLVIVEEKLAESNAANVALSSQLENISPQLASLELSLTNARSKLKEEQSLRRAAEQSQDDADQKIRALEQTIISLKEECDVVHEELAFKESELEETRLELEVEKQQLLNELSTLRKAESEKNGNVGSPRMTTVKAVNGESSSVPSEVGVAETAIRSAPSNNTEEYAKHLEDELELVTEQLIETEKLLSSTQGDLSEKEDQLQVLHQQMSRYDAEESQLNQLQNEHDELLTEHERLRVDFVGLQEELTACREDIHLQAESFTALEQDYQSTLQLLEEERKKHQSIVEDLHVQIREAELNSKSNLTKASLIDQAIQEANQQNEAMMEQVAALEIALENAKKDYRGCSEELEQVNARFDEARAEAEKAGYDTAKEEMRNVMRADTEHEICTVKESLEQLVTENKLLQEKVDEAEVKLASMKDRRDDHSGSDGPSTSSVDPVVAELQKQLHVTKEELLKKDSEMFSFTEEMTSRLQKAEDTVVHLEAELHGAKAQLAEADAHLIVLRREKERQDLVIPKSPTRAAAVVPNASGAPSMPLDEEELETLRGRSLENSLPDPATPSHTARPRSSSPSSVMRLELRLAEEVKRYATLEKGHNELQDQKRMCEVRIKHLEEDLKALQHQLLATTTGSSSAVAAVTTQMSRLSSLGSAERGMDLISEDEIAGKRLEKIICSRDVKMLTEELKIMEQKCNSQREYNAQLLGKMLHLQGNIQVYCRIRPLTLQEIQSGARCVVEPLSETEVGCYDERTKKWKSFGFDRVWGPDQSQTSVFQDVEPLALSVVDGFNACIFAYVFLLLQSATTATRFLTPISCFMITAMVKRVVGAFHRI
jgi:kinesin family member C2/C3